MKQLIFLVLLSISACKADQSSDNDASQDSENTNSLVMPEWARNANIYEVNVRQYTLEGTLNAFSEHLPRLKEMGVDILWFMPIYPISETKRKGGLGSYYAVSDFTKINPEYGTMDDMDALITKIHDLDMKIILDWVPNHTGWDHEWIKDHPEYYTQNDEGEIIDPSNPTTGESWGWTDVADLNYDNHDMRKEMIEDLKFWISEHNIDGYRCDVAGEVPDDFWAEAIPKLQEIKNVFMLAEAEHPEHRNSGNFHMSYGWHFHHIMNEIAKGEKDVSEIRSYMAKIDSTYDLGFPMMFTSNHDENSWNGTEFERMGEGHKAFAVLASTFEGMPLIYSGQEEPLKKRLAFFEKDTIGFGQYHYADFYKSLLSLKHENEALWNGKYGGKPVLISDSNEVIVFIREKNNNQIITAINLTPESSDFRLNIELPSRITHKFGKELKWQSNESMALGPWEYSIVSN